MWRVESVLDSSGASGTSTRATRTVGPDVEVARQMLADARKWAHAGQFARARQLIEWASTLEVDWRTQPMTPAGMLNELEGIESRLDRSVLFGEGDDSYVDSPHAPSGRWPTAGVRVPDVAPRRESNILRAAADAPSFHRPQAADGTSEIGSYEAPAATFGRAASTTDAPSAGTPSAGMPATGTSSAGMSGPQASVPSGDPPTNGQWAANSPASATPREIDTRDVPPSAIFADGGWQQQDLTGRVAGAGMVLRPEAAGFWRTVAIGALCGLGVMVLFAFLMLRRVIHQQRHLLHVMVEATTQRLDATPTPDLAAAARSTPASAARSDQAMILPFERPTETNQPDTFAARKQRADDCLREQNSELVRQLISSNVAIREQVADKRTAAA